MIVITRRCDKTRMVDRLLWLASAALCMGNLAVSFAGAQESHARFPLTSQQIMKAMEGRQLSTQGVRVTIAAPITASIAEPQLEILSAALLNSHEMRLRVSCHNHSECISFFAVATFPADVDASKLPLKLEHQPGTQTATAETHTASSSPSIVTPQTKAVQVGGTAGKPIIAAGAPATLDFEDQRIHIHLDVICLQSGAAGDKVRVSTRDRKQVYVAEIVTPTLLKGSL